MKGATDMITKHGTILKYVIRENIDNRRPLVQGMPPYHKVWHDDMNEAVKTAKQIRKRGLYVTESEYADGQRMNQDFTITEHIVWSEWF